jgi:hypothetical protein
MCVLSAEGFRKAICSFHVVLEQLFVVPCSFQKPFNIAARRFREVGKNFKPAKRKKRNIYISLQIIYILAIFHAYPKVYTDPTFGYHR